MTTGNLPKKEADINTVAMAVAQAWAANPDIALIWTDAVKLKEAAEAFSASYMEREGAKGVRRSVTQDLKDVNMEIDTSTEFVKNYIADKFSKRNAPAHYVSFGIVKTRRQYKLPLDNDARLYALETMINGIEANGFNELKYGKAYWTALRERFANVKQQASETDKTSAEHVGIKAGQKALIRKTLNSLILSIKANYPDTWHEELRIWGFQKEKY